MLQTKAGTTYKGLIIPEGATLSPRLQEHIDSMKAAGAAIIYGVDKSQMARAAKPECMRTDYALKTIRRSNGTGYHYFVANLTPTDVSALIPLAVPFKDAVWFNPMTGDISKARFQNGCVDISLQSGESMILQTYDQPLPTTGESPVADHQTKESSIALEGPWTLSFTEEAPRVGTTYQLPQLQTWETLDEKTAVTMGTGIYTTTVKLSKKQAAAPWLIDLGDVRESARVYINGQFIGCAWAVPFILDTKSTLRAGVNDIRIEVTNLPANRIAALDRQGVKWRKMEEINVVDINYKKSLYDQWEPVKSGLNSTVSFIKKQQ